MDDWPSIESLSKTMPFRFTRPVEFPAKMMKKLNPTLALIVGVALITSGCASTVLKGTDTPMAYQSTLLQYRILTEGLPTPKASGSESKQGFKWLSLTERTMAGATLPLSAVVETLFLPVTYGYTAYLNHFQMDQYPLSPDRNGMLSRIDQKPQPQPQPEPQPQTHDENGNPLVSP